MVSSRPGDAERIPIAVTSFSARRPGVNHARTAGKTDIDDASGRLDKIERQRRQARVVGSVNHRIEGQVRERVLGPGVFEPEGAGERQRFVRATHHMHLRASGAGEHRSEQSDGPRSEHQGSVAGGQGSGLRCA